MLINIPLVFCADERERRGGRGGGGGVRDDCFLSGEKGRPELGLGCGRLCTRVLGSRSAEWVPPRGGARCGAFDVWQWDV